MEFKGSKTEANLHTAFAGESEARNKYTYYAGIAKKEGYNQIASIFEETAGNEKEHAKIWFKILMSGGIPHASLPDTMANLKDAAAGEHYEWTDMYAGFAKEAREEGFIDIANFFKELREVEEDHAKRFKELYDKLDDGTMFAGPRESKWVCMNCGYIHEGSEAPEKCPLCGYPRAYFKPYCEIEDL